MNLSDFPSLEIDENTGATFGETGQVEILGHFRKSKYVKTQVVRCSICAVDVELFGEGVFSSHLDRLKTNQLPCGCSKYHRYSEQERLVVVNRKCREKGYTFLGYAENSGPFDTRKLVLECPKHGIWRTTTFGSFTQKSSVGCGLCAKENNPACNGQEPNIILDRITSAYSASGLKEKGVEFLGLCDGYKNQHSRITLSCVHHGIYTISINQFLVKPRACRACVSKEKGENSRDDLKMINSFNVTGKFPFGTVFERSTTPNKYGHHTLWNVFCPTCDQTNTSTYQSLQGGILPCSCREVKTNEGYINIVYDNSTPIALKFGISSNSKIRSMKLNRKSLVNLELYKTFKFLTDSDCRKAESEIKNKLVCKIVEKKSLPDGWTETTYLSNLEKVVEIYKKHGGIEVD